MLPNLVSSSYSINSFDSCTILMTILFNDNLLSASAMLREMLHDVAIVCPPAYSNSLLTPPLSFHSLTLLFLPSPPLLGLLASFTMTTMLERNRTKDWEGVQWRHDLSARAKQVQRMRRRKYPQYLCDSQRFLSLSHPESALLLISDVERKTLPAADQQDRRLRELR